MSAYIMDPLHIAAIGKFVELHGRQAPRYAGDPAPRPGGALFVYRKNRPDSDYRTPQQVAEVLMRENVRSVNYRYNERTHVPKVDVSAVEPKDASLKDVRALLATWDYQACERKDYKRSEAYETYVRLLELMLDVAAGADR